MKALITLCKEYSLMDTFYFIHVDPLNSDGSATTTDTLPFRICQLMKDRHLIENYAKEDIQKAKKLLEKLGWEVIVDL